TAVGNPAGWVDNALDGTVKSIDPPTSAVITTIHVGSTPTAIATDGDDVWVASGGEGKLVRIDERTDRHTAKVAIGSSPQSLVVADGTRSGRACRTDRRPERGNRCPELPCSRSTLAARLAPP